MLSELAIHNLGVLTSAGAQPGAGLTVVTGETGAGKTMVVESLRLLKGDRADASRVRTGASKAMVEGRFVVDERKRAAVEERGGEIDENGEVIITRSVTDQGRSKAYLGGRAVPAGVLRELTADLITIHGQHDQLRLMSADAQRDALDESDPAIIPLREDYAASYASWRSLAKDLKTRVEKRRELAQETDRLQFAITEISTVAPEAGEEEELATSIHRLQSVDQLREAASTALALIDGEEDSFEDTSAASALGEAQAALASAGDPELSRLSDVLSEVTSQLTEVSVDLGRFVDDLPLDPDALDKALRRQQALKGLTRKYAPDLAGVIEWWHKAEAKLAKLDVSTESLEALKKKVVAAEKSMRAKAKKLTAARATAATALSTAVTSEIHGLSMGNSRFDVAIEKAKPSASGFDQVEFQLNGKKIAASASGGELSRVMLAIEVIVSQGGATLVFDEVDQGVGGRAAGQIGKRLALLAKSNQVIVVTHLPQVAAYAQTHVFVSKDVEKDEAESAVRVLSGEERVEEIARMMAGLDDTATGRAHAKELLELASEFNKQGDS
ncbi:DNA repair protein RecN [Corynebacterium glucuronolyticum]|uniref:DNA repair protein RecN n=1 Tax=Corynebacterium glucuronolyticum TaxID=39791 RepID=A0A7T4EEB8_9CORY|nr:DNA repair protein RecN [Corynebacterium glucuronolyticum]QQB45815.1 DNA repair protein RecN [Corynebacterium glucuronolyticum]WKD63485.1 DNA repair protein RecN [Corynebacterium glucuronolyticum DSM 44120]SMB80367.1 DNA replication and repair protein RecN [Corynebacterium glucuronolyticum]